MPVPIKSVAGFAADRGWVEAFFLPDVSWLEIGAALIDTLVMLGCHFVLHLATSPALGCLEVPAGFGKSEGKRGSA